MVPPFVLIVSATTFVAWTAHGQAAVGLFNAPAVLLVGLSVRPGTRHAAGPLNALATLAARGMVVRSGDALERLAQVDLVMFDKTGTLSEERQSLVDFVAREPGQRTWLLHVLREVQSRSPHRRLRRRVGTGQDSSPVILSLKPVPPGASRRGFRTANGNITCAWVRRTGSGMTPTGDRLPGSYGPGTTPTPWSPSKSMGTSRVGGRCANGAGFRTGHAPLAGRFGMSDHDPHRDQVSRPGT